MRRIFVLKYVDVVKDMHNNIKLSYDDSAKEVKVIQNGMVIKTVDYSDEKHSARADQELSSYMQKLKKNLPAFGGEILCGEVFVLSLDGGIDRELPADAIDK